jgi:MYXO-CTERM domain-containing protein
LKSQGLFVYAVGFGDKVDPLMLGGVAHAAGTERDPSCDPNAVSTAQSNLCYFNVDAGNTQDFVNKLNDIVTQIQSEVCDGIDNDCNGLVDDGLTKACGGQSCGGAGTQTCVNGTWGMCNVQLDPEVCDGKDNDCDGIVDAVPCHTACGDGLRHCVNGQISQTCDVANLPKEICNGRDDNCDGQVDEGCDCSEGEMKPCMLNECSGMQVCSFGKFGDCQADVSAEVCDGKDNDCNGVIDEGKDLCSQGSVCARGKCVSGAQPESVDPQPEDVIYVYRGQGVSRACNSRADDAPGSPVWIVLVLAVVFFRRRRS